jgi:hypothetical protein
MSNNIYDILKKMQNLEAPKQSLTESKKAKPDYIDIDKDGDKTEPMKKAAREKSKGAVAEAVATVERQLAEKYQGFKKSVAEGVKLKGTIKSTDSGEEYRAEPGHRVKAEFEPGSTGKPKIDFVKDKSSDSEQTGQAAKPAKPTDQPKVDEGVQAKGTIEPTDSGEKYTAAPGYRVKAEFEPGSTGKPKMGFVKDKSSEPEQTGQGAKPADQTKPVNKKEVDESALQAYLGKKKYGEQGMKALQKAGRDGASKEKMAKIRAQHDKMDEAEVEEGNRFSGNLMKARAKGLKRADLDGDGDMEPVREEENKYMNKDGTFKNPRTDAEHARQKAERQRQQDLSNELWMGPKDKAPKYKPSDMERSKDSEAIARAMDQDREERDAARSPLNKIGNYGSRLVFGKDIPVNEGRTSMREGWEEMQKYLEKKRGPESKGGSGKKAGTRYGGSAQRDDDEETDGEGQAVVKKKGRPKGTGGGAKFNFKKPKD